MIDTAHGPVTIYHNPACGTSRNVLALIRASGIEPTAIEYLQHPPDRDTLRALIARTGFAVRDVMRIKGTPYKELGLDAPDLDDDYLIGRMLQHPILINRPLVVTPRGVKLCRPSEVVLDLLPALPAADLAKEDGTPVLMDVPVAATTPALRTALEQAGLPADDITEPGRVFFAYSTLAGEHVGHAGFEQHGREILLRSIVVPEAQRHRGIGRGIVPLLMRRAFDAGGRRAWLLTTTAAGFFEKAGFKPADRGQAPAAILASRQASALCPSTAALLVRSIDL
jgi:arsenate reductase (glutaredoxin)